MQPKKSVALWWLKPQKILDTETQRKLRLGKARRKHILCIEMKTNTFTSLSHAPRSWVRKYTIYLHLEQAGIQKKILTTIKKWRVNWKIFHPHFNLVPALYLPYVHCILRGMLIGGKLPLNILRLRGERSKVGLTSGTEIPHWNDPLLHNTLIYIRSNLEVERLRRYMIKFRYSAFYVISWYKCW